MDAEALRAYGIDLEKGLKICMGSPAFYKKILLIFRDTNSLARARAALAARDYKAMFLCMHELKGTSGNAGLTALYDASVPLVEALRAADMDETRVNALFAAVQAAYDRALAGIALYTAQ